MGANGRAVKVTSTMGEGDGWEFNISVPPAAGGHAQGKRLRPGLLPGTYRWQILYGNRIAASWPFVVRVQEPSGGSGQPPAGLGRPPLLHAWEAGSPAKGAAVTVVGPF